METLVNDLMLEAITYLEANNIIDCYTSENLQENYYFQVDYNKKNRVLGYCNSGKRVIALNHYYIEFCESRDMYNELLNTMIHEILHALYAGDGHTGRWKAAANRINKLDPYFGNIKRTSNISGYYKEFCEYVTGKSYNVNSENSIYKYACTCTKCNYTWKYQKKTRFVTACFENNAKDWTCACGGKNFKAIKL